MQTRRFELKPERPYSLARTASRLIRISTLVDRIDEKGGYSRCLRLDGRLALLHVRQTAPPSRHLDLSWGQPSWRLEGPTA